MGVINEWVIESSEYIKARIDNIPDTVIVFESNMDSLIEELDNKIVLEYKEIPHFSLPNVLGHTSIETKGELIYGNLNYTPVIIMNGTFHYYDGYDMEHITFPMRVFKNLGIKNVILTNASKGINFNYVPSDFVIIKDHINFSGVLPLRGNYLDEFGTKFPDMTNVYDGKMIVLAEQIAAELGFSFNEGIYAFLQGPDSETPAEVKALRTFEADVLGFSMIPEATVAKFLGLKVIGVSCVTAMAAGVLRSNTPDEGMMVVSEAVRQRFSNWIRLMVRALYLVGRGNDNIFGEGKYLNGI